ncbi:hypothetical protein JOF44_000760 [Brachybacterium fresconis]|uniref:Uncharacterized protein n=1 Tax=Brachybacterium fresconis TaxID=173363 RepID=A0ABS4YGD8_9MICO|nr:hypothetical protein [Brachybacterium fresconis]
MSHRSLTARRATKVRSTATATISSAVPKIGSASATRHLHHDAGLHGNASRVQPGPPVPRVGWPANGRSVRPALSGAARRCTRTGSTRPRTSASPPYRTLLRQGPPRWDCRCRGPRRTHRPRETCVSCLKSSPCSSTASSVIGVVGKTLRPAMTLMTAPAARACAPGGGPGRRRLNAPPKSRPGTHRAVLRTATSRPVGADELLERRPCRPSNRPRRAGRCVFVMPGLLSEESGYLARAGRPRR